MFRRDPIPLHPVRKRNVQKFVLFASRGEIWRVVGFRTRSVPMCSKRLTAFALFNFFDQLRHHFEEIADDAKVRILENRRLGVFIDCDDVF
jgi:hypothetical protein